MNAVERGKLAADVLANPAYVEAFELIENGIYNQWCEAKDTDEAEQLRKLRKLLLKSRKVLESAMEQGKYEAVSVERKASALARFGRAFRSD